MEDWNVGRSGKSEGFQVMKGFCRSPSHINFRPSRAPPPQAQGVCNCIRMTIPLGPAGQGLVVIIMMIMIIVIIMMFVIIMMIVIIMIIVMIMMIVKIMMMEAKIMMIFGCRAFDSQ